MEYGLAGVEEAFDCGDAVSVIGNLEEKLGKVGPEMDKIDGEMVDGLELNVDSTSCALKFEVTNETSLIKEDCADRFGNSCQKQKVISKFGETVDYKNVEKQEREGEREKRPRRKRNSKKNSEAQSSSKGSGNEAKSTKLDCAITDAHGNKAKITYSIEELEALRFLDLETQKKKWIEMYCGLSPSVQKEYDTLVNCDLEKHFQIEFDLRKQFQNVQRSHGLHGEDCTKVVDNVTDNVNPFDPDTEWSEEEEEDDDGCNSILKPAFSVSGEPNFDSGPPQDGLEYLRRVRWEAEQIPNVKVVKLEKKKVNKEQTPYMPNIPDISKCPEHLFPLKEWEDTFLTDFVELRLAFSRINGSSASSSSILKLLSRVDEKETNTQFPENLVQKINNIISNEVESCDEETEHKCNAKGSSSKESPTMSVIQKMDSVARLSMLRKKIASVENMTYISMTDFEWLFALCIVIDTPLDGDLSASLRCLLRKVASLRAEKPQMDDEVIMLNIIATITGKYFGQSG